MKYMLLMQFAGTRYETEDWNPDDFKAHIEFMGQVNSDLERSGELVDSQGLADPSEAKVVRAGSDGPPEVTDGPYSEFKEFLAGYWIVDCESVDRAIEIASHISAAPGPGGAPLNMPIQLRAVMSGPPEEI